MPRLRRSPIAGAFLDGVNAASLALMIAVTWDLGREAIVDLTTVALAVLGAVGLIRFRLNSVWLVIAGGVVGAALVHFARLIQRLGKVPIAIVVIDHVVADVVGLIDRTL